MISHSIELHQIFGVHRLKRKRITKRSKRKKKTKGREIYNSTLVLFRLFVNNILLFVFLHIQSKKNSSRCRLFIQERKRENLVNTYASFFLFSLGI